MLQYHPVHIPTTQFVKSHDIISTHPLLHLESGRYEGGFSTKILFVLLVSAIRDVRPARLNQLDSTTLIGINYEVPDYVINSPFPSNSATGSIRRFDFCMDGNRCHARVVLPILIEVARRLDETGTCCVASFCLLCPSRYFLGSVYCVVFKPGS